jgi:acyl dehydratase
MHTMTDKIPIARLAERVGSELGTSSWITLDQTRINEFAHCTGDDQWIHVDADRAARESPFGGTIAHGYLTLALLAPTTFEVMVANVALKQALNYGLDKVRFIAPVRAGKRVRNRIKIIAVEDKSGGRFLVTTENTIEIDGEERPALVATALAMLMG